MGDFARYALLALGLGAVAYGFNKGCSSCSSDDERHEPGEVLLKIKDSVQPGRQNLKKGVLGVESLDKLTRKYGIRWAEQVFDTVQDDDSMRRIYQLEFAEDADIEDIIEELQEHPAVEYVEPDYIKAVPEPEEDEAEDKGTLKKFFDSFGRQGRKPNDKYFERQWALEKMRAPYAWERQTGSQGITVAIVDTGVRYDHPDLKDNILHGRNGKVKGYNFVRNNGNPMDGNGHGTHCAGIVAAVTNNQIGIAGTAWNVRLMPVKSLSDFGSGFSEDLADGVVWAAQNGARVISNSWGSRLPSNTIKYAVKHAAGRGAVVIAAGGNSDSGSPFYPSSFRETISVGATDGDDEKASFSNYGPNAEVSAPGVAIFSTLPLGRFGNSTGYGSLSGTSMAAPYVAGAVALVLSENPKLTSAQIRKLLKETGDEVDHDGMGPRINLEKLLEAVRGKKYAKR